jgi:hypothetical protein
MRKLLQPMGLLFCIGTMMSCSKSGQVVPVENVPVNPISDYTITPDPIDGFTFKFSSLAKNHTGLEWRFGDDTLKTDLNPTHTYLDTGDPTKKYTYTVDLKTVSSTGNVSHKYTNVTIKPDSILQMSAVKTGTANQLQFGVTVKAPVASVLWTFIDQGLFGAAGPTTTSPLAAPLKTYAVNSVNTVKVKITSTKGSVATISRTVTPGGIAQDITVNRTSFTTNHENLSNLNENSPKMVDGNTTSTKFLMGTTTPFTYPFIATFGFASPIVVKMYAIGNCGDLPKRDPKSWTFEGSNDGINWTILDTQLMTQTFYDQQTALGATTDAQRYWKLFYFSIANPQPFSQYRWKVASIWGDAKMQVSEFQLYK